MPIHNMSFDDGVFFARQVGYVDQVDGRMWGSALKKWSKTSDTPIVAIVDMQDVERLCPTLVKAFSNVLASGNIVGIAVITSDLMTSRNDRVLSKLDNLDGVRVFSAVGDGYTFARMRLNPSIGYGSGAAVYAFAAI